MTRQNDFCLNQDLQNLRVLSFVILTHGVVYNSPEPTVT